ncbi:hypothetical protein [Paenibacillus pini]|uniref:Uncharacterized protein n=1 Tax=Paenibacillus pini JCM 16418 TaxID=1236976 RepID=W7Z8V6_9BACL|nr:hypothetical protein [Paenibacillus pini]GAF10899.1 hypothetical protein JCM16418_5133 [Paenibacillus pini JCM 16418]
MLRYVVIGVSHYGTPYIYSDAKGKSTFDDFNMAEEKKRQLNVDADYSYYVAQLRL